MLGEVEVAAVGDALQLGPAHREQVLDVARWRWSSARARRRRARAAAGGRGGCRGRCTSRMRSSIQRWCHCGGLAGRHEELDLHLLELAGAEDEVARRDLVAERLADLGDPERRLLARELQDVLEVDEDALRGLGAQVDRPSPSSRDRAHVGLEHEVELRGSESSPPHSGQRISPSASSAPSCSSRRWSSRQRRLHSPRHWTSGSVKPSRWPEASQVCGCIRIAASSATMSSRSCTHRRATTRP